MNALVVKEIRLLLPAYGAALPLAVISALLLPTPPNSGLGVSENSLAVVLSLLPLCLGTGLLGLSSFGREFGLDTFALFLAQPLERKHLWSTKILVLGGLLNAVLLWTADRIGVATGAGSAFGGPGGTSSGPPLGLLCLVFLALSFISFYASTLARNIVQALAAAVVTVMVFWLMGFMASRPWQAFGGWLPWDVLRHWLWEGSLGWYVAVPTLVVTVVWLAYRNFRCLAGEASLWRRNILGLAAALLFTAAVTSVIYHRAWEWLGPLEPAHGPARLAGPRAPDLYSYGGSALLVRLPDGELWVDRFGYEPGRHFLAFGPSAWFSLGGKWTSLSRDPFVAGSNWVDGVATFCDTVAIRSDLTLWVSEKPLQPWDPEKVAKPPMEESARLIRFGDETNWQRVVRHTPYSVILLKRDGTLWHWGTNNFNEKKEWPGLRSFPPHRLGTGSDWAAIVSAGYYGIFAWTREGRAWLLGAPWIFHLSTGSRQAQEAALEPGILMLPLASLDNTKWRSLAPCWPFYAGVREDGTLWAWSLPRPARAEGGRTLSGRMVQIGQGTNWTAVAGFHHALTALKADGSLLEWDYGDRLLTEEVLTSRPPRRLGTHHDWVAVGSLMDEIVALAADGSLWCWWNRSRPNEDQPLLAPSRKPARITTVLGRPE